ncbi:MAG TPA: efflux RND transporter permease subunit [Gemmatimonadales bacterium]
MIRFSIRRPIAASMAYLVAAILGVLAWRNIPVELLPEIDLPRLEVTADWAGASPETMEAFVTSPLEAAIQQVRGVEKVTSTSTQQNGAGRAEISVEFARDTDMDFARLDLLERFAALDDVLPPEAAGPFVEPYVPDELNEQRTPFLRYTVTGPLTTEALRTLADETIAPGLRQVDGVADVRSYGGRARVLEVRLDDAALAAHGLRPADVQRRIRELELVREAGAVHGPDGTLRTLSLRQRAGSIDDVRRAVLVADGRRLVRVSDVGTVHDTYEDRASHYRIDGRPAVQLAVVKEPRTNTVQVADSAKARLAALEPTLPTGVRLILDADESREIRRQLTDLRSRAVLSALVVLATLIAFLGSIRSAVIVFSTIAFSILLALNFVYFAGYTLNVLTLMGLAMGFGLIADNAIVVLENIFRRWREGEDAVAAAEHGARDVVLAILAATATTIVVFIPFVYLQGELRLYYVPLAVVVGLSLVASLLVSFSFIPALGARLLGPRRAAAPAATDERRPPAYVRLYAAMLRGTLRFPRATVLVAFLLVGGSWWVFDRYVTRGLVWGRWGGGDRSSVDVRITQPRGEELERTDEIARWFEEQVLGRDYVDRVTTRVFPQAAMLTITFPKDVERTGIPLAVKEELTAAGFGFGGAEVRVYGRGPSFYGGGSSPPNYSIRILGYNYLTVREIAEGLTERLKSMPRIRDVDPNASRGWYERDRASEIVLALDRGRLALHDLTMEDVVRQVRAAVAGGGYGGNVRVGGEERRFLVKLSGYETFDVLALQELALPARNGTSVRLADVATVEEREVLGRIVREDQQYQRTVAYEFRGPGKLGDRTRDAVVNTTVLPDGYTLVGAEEWSWSDEESRQLYGVLGVSLLLVFMVTAALFESLRQPVCVLLTVPMALIGVFVTFYLTEASFTREAIIGVIMMGGIVVNNSILLIDRINQLRRAGGVPLLDAIVEGTLHRVRPILMTSVSTVLGLLPLVLFSGYADQNIWNALGYALIGGLTSSTILVLTVTPAIYLLLERGPERRRARTVMAAAVAGAALVASACTSSGDTNASADDAVRTTVDSAGGVVHVTNTGTPPRWSLEPLLTIERAGDEELGRVTGVAADWAGYTYVADAIARRIHRITPEGELLVSVGREGAGPGEFRSMDGLAFVGGKLASLDAGNGRIGLVAPDGEGAPESVRWQAFTGDVTLEQTAPGEAYAPLFVRGTGDAPGRRLFLRLINAGTPDTLAPVEALKPAAPRSTTCETSDGALHFFSVRYSPRGFLAPAPGQRLVAGDGAHYRLAYVAPSGDTLKVVARDVAPVPVSDAEWAEVESDWTEFRERTRGGRCDDASITRPAAKPAFASAFHDDRGRLWVEAWDTAGFRFDVFDTTGALVGELPAPPERDRSVRPYVRTGRLVYVAKDSMDVQSVRVATIAERDPAATGARQDR